MLISVTLNLNYPGNFTAIKCRNCGIECVNGSVFIEEEEEKEEGEREENDDDHGGGGERGIQRSIKAGGKRN